MAGPFSLSNLSNTALTAGLGAASGGAFGDYAQMISNAVRQPSDAVPPASAPAPLAPQPPAPYTSPANGPYSSVSRPLLIVGGLVGAALVLFLILRK